MPPYFKQNNPSTCSLAVLRMILASYGVNVTEEDLLKNIEKDYGRKFSNIWNTTIARLASEYGVKTTMYALWPLFKTGVMKEALAELETDQNQFNVGKYENPNDKDVMPEPLSLAYKEMFKAVEVGCKVVYGSITENRIRHFVKNGMLIQTSVKVHKLYSDAPIGFHSILIYGITGDQVRYHDPFVGPSLNVNIKKLIKAASDVGAFMSYIDSKML
jgi:hypothetical protein